ncbi:MAG: translocation/assembly module TamB domain-containing protein [Pseudomonadota bacterium]
MRALRIFGIVVVALLGLLALVFAGLQTGTGKRLLADTISDLASSPTDRVVVRGLGGFVPTDMTIERVELADKDGTWLTVEDVRLEWSFGSLLAGRLRIDDLRAGRVAVLRPPASGGEQSAPDEGGMTGLPIGVDLRALVIEQLHLGAALAGVESDWKVVGHALLPADLAAGKLVLEANRTDATGRLTADIGFDLGRMTVDGELSLTEGQRGLVATLLERPDLDSLSLRLSVRGDAQAGSGDLTLTAGDVARADGKASWGPRDGSTEVTVRLDAAAPGLPPGALADAIRGPATLRAEATVSEETATLRTLTFSLGPVNLHGSAQYDRKADRLDAKATLGANEPGALAPLLGGAQWRDLDVDVTADLTGLKKRPQGTAMVKGDVEEVSLAAIDPRIPEVAAVDFSAEVGLVEGRIDLRSLKIDSPLASIAGEGSYAPRTETGTATATVELPRLEPFSALAGRSLAGSATIKVDATSDRDGLKATWQGTVENVTTAGMPPGLASKPVELSGTASLGRDETWTLNDVRVASGGASAAISGQGKDQIGTLTIALDLPDLGLLQSELQGSARANARIEMGVQSTAVELKADLEGLAYEQITARQLSLAASASIDEAGAVTGRLKAEGSLEGEPLSLDGSFARSADGGITVPSFQGKWASALLDVERFAVTEARTSGHARLRVERLEDAAALAGVALAGSLEAEITAEPGAGDGRVAFRLQGNDLAMDAIRVGSVALRGTVEDPTDRAVVDASLSVDRIVGAAGIASLDATVKGERSALDVVAKASGPQTNLELSATVGLRDGETTVSLSRLQGRRDGVPVALTAPTRITLAGERTTIEPTSLRVGGGRVNVRGTVAATSSDLQVDIAALPLSLIDTFVPGTGLQGTFQGRASVSGPLDAPVVDATYRVDGLRFGLAQAALLPTIAVRGTAQLRGSQASLEARLSTPGRTALNVKARATLPQGSAGLSGSASLTGTVDIAPFSPLLGNQIRNVSGTLRPNVTIEFGGRDITGSGTVDLTNLSVALPEAGLRLTQGQGQLVLQGDTLRLQRLVFDAGRGSLTASGTVRIDPEQGLMPDLTIAARNALLINRPDLVATVSSDVRVTGATSRAIDVSGTITVDRAEIAVGVAQSASYPTLDVREINKPGGTPASAAAAAVTPPQGQPQPSEEGTPIRLSLAIQAPQAIFVRGRGLDAELSGDLRVGGTAAAPTVIGGLTLRRGTFNLAGRQLTFDKGIVTLDNLNRIDPRLDFEASTTVQSTKITVAIGGTAREPSISVSSSPPLPQDEVMALLLFGKSTSQLSPFELAQAAQGIAELMGQDPGTGVLSRLRTGLGLDRLSVGSSGNGSNASNISLEAGRYVAPGVYVGAQQGATGNSSRGVVQIEVLDHVKIEGTIGADSDQRIGVKMEWDY